MSGAHQDASKPGVSRRRFLGGIGAGAAALAAGSVFGLPERAAAAPYIKYGAVCSPFGDFNRKIDILRRIRPQTVRVSMYHGGAVDPKFSFGDLDRLLSTGVTEMIIQSSEDPDSGKATDELNKVMPYIQSHPGTLFVFELGNEPDWHTDPGTARYKRLTAMRDNQWRIGGNFYLAVNMPAGRYPTAQDPFQWSSGQYFDTFVRDAGDGLGGLLGGPYAPPIITVHSYSWDYLERHPERGEDNPYKMIDYVRGWNSSVNMKITEAGINSAASDRGYRYANFGPSVANETGGQIDSVCFYGLPDVEDGYSIYEGEADQLGTHS